MRPQPPALGRCSRHQPAELRPTPSLLLSPLMRLLSPLSTFSPGGRGRAARHRHHQVPALLLPKRAPRRASLRAALSPRRIETPIYPAALAHLAGRAPSPARAPSLPGPGRRLPRCRDSARHQAPATPIGSGPLPPSSPRSPPHSRPMSALRHGRLSAPDPTSEPDPTAPARLRVPRRLRWPEGRKQRRSARLSRLLGCTRRPRDIARR